MDDSTRLSLVSAGDHIDNISNTQIGRQRGGRQAALNEVSGDSKLCREMQVSE